MTTSKKARSNKLIRFLGPVVALALLVATALTPVIVGAAGPSDQGGPPVSTTSWVEYEP